MSNGKQQTAVESIKTTFFHYAEPYPYFSEEEKWVITKEELFEVLQQAKEMEKQKMIEFGIMIQNNALMSYRILSPEQHYNKTYGGQNE